MKKDRKQGKTMVSVIIPVYNNAAYLEETLGSLERQSYKDFEVILVNDGSTDESVTIIDRYVKKDCRFKKIEQENQGVSAARNAALEIAQGTYVTFVDGDDTLPQDSLKKMAETAEKDHSDLLIGGIRRIDGFSEKVNQRTKNLKYKKEIKKDDLDLVHGLSLCNKWFYRQIIEEHELRLEKFKHLEDGVFLYAFLQYTQKIRYCDAIVYDYWKRVPVNGGSVTQRVEKGLLEDAIRAYERLLELTKGYSEAFLQELTYRINSTTLIGDYYKKIWLLDPQTEDLLISYAGKILSEQKEEYRKRTIISHPGLELEKGLRSKEQLRKDPLFTIVISKKVGKEQIETLLRSIYGQAVPSFSVFLDETYQDVMDETWKRKENLRFLPLGNSEKEWIKAAEKDAGSYLLFLDQEVIFDHDTLAKAYEIFQKKKCHAVRVFVVSSEMSAGMTGYIFEKQCFYQKKDLWNAEEYFQADQVFQKSEIAFQKTAPMIRICDMDRVYELTKPGFAERMKQKGKEAVKDFYRSLKMRL